MTMQGEMCCPGLIALVSMQVCLSLLGTWHGSEDEKWHPDSSTLWQILVSIQAMVLVEDPYFNEPNVEQMRGQAEGDAASAKRNAALRLDTVRRLLCRNCCLDDDCVASFAAMTCSACVALCMCMSQAVCRAYGRQRHACAHREESEVLRSIALFVLDCHLPGCYTGSASDCLSLASIGHCSCRCAGR